MLHPQRVDPRTVVASGGTASMRPWQTPTMVKVNSGREIGVLVLMARYAQGASEQSAVARG